jgi:Domain of Unknown Function with PDB structure (DUF3857)
MILVRRLFFILAALSALGAQAFALTDTLEELIQEKSIIMPDLAARYPDAEAVIILDEKIIDQSRVINPVYIERHVVVKILKESAVEKFRTVKLPFYSEVKIVDFEARTINDGSLIKVRDIPERKVDLEGQDAGFIYPCEQRTTMYALRSVEVSSNPNAGDLLKISENPVFHKKKAEVWRIRQIDFPEVRVGSVLEYYYRIEQKRVVLYDRYFFQKMYPVLKASYIMRNAKLMRFLYKYNNFTTKPTIVFEPRFTNLESQYNNELRTAMRTIDVTSKPENWQFYGHHFISLQMDTLDAYPDNIPFGPVYNDYSPRVDVFLREAVNLWRKEEKDVRVRTEMFSPNWNYPANRLRKSTVMHERRARKSKEQIADVIKDAATPEEKVAAAVKWTRENIKDNGELRQWDNYFWGCLAKAPDEVLRDGTGNAAEIAAFLVNALQLNDLWVYPAYGKSRGNGKFLTDVFIETQFDIPLVALEVRSRKYKFWQASSDVAMPVDYVDYNLEGTKVLLNLSDADEISSKVEQLPASISENNRSVINAVMTLGGDGSVKGSLTQDLTGHMSTKLRREMVKVSEDQRVGAWEQSLSGKFTGVSTSGAPSIGDPSALSPKYSVSADVSLAGVSRSVDGGLAVKAGVLTDPFSSALSGEPREMAVTFPFMGEFSSDIEIKVPAGYALPDSLPAPAELKTRGLYYQRILAKKGGDTLLIKREFKLSMPVMPARSYNRRYGRIFADIQKMDAEEIVLPKL